MAQASAQPGPDLALRQEAQRQTLSIKQGGQDWPTMETEFFIIHYQPLMQPNKSVLKELDLFVTNTLGLWEVSEEILADFHHHKMSYYLCDEATVTKLTGYQTRGMADLAGRAVISSHFPHFHELTHLLVHYIQAEPPLQTHPLIQEGIACLLGGRWGRTSAIVLYTGWVHRAFGMGELSDVLTQDDFFSFPGGADVTYPLGAMLCEMVRQEAGWPGILELNERLSGSVEQVAALKKEDVVAVIYDICHWEQEHGPAILDETMGNLWAEFRRCGIEPADSAPDLSPRQEVHQNNGRVLVWPDANQKLVKVVAQEYPVYLVSAGIDSDWGNSSLYDEHFPDQEYHGQHYGMRCSPESISLYDYATSQLIATWVAGFTGELDACGTGADGLVFRVSQEFANALTDLLAEGSEIR